MINLIATWFLEFPLFMTFILELGTRNTKTSCFVFRVSCFVYIDTNTRTLSRNTKQTRKKLNTKQTRKIGKLTYSLRFLRTTIRHCVLSFRFIACFISFNFLLLINEIIYNIFLNWIYIYNKQFFIRLFKFKFSSSEKETRKNKKF